MRDVSAAKMVRIAGYFMLSYTFGQNQVLDWSEFGVRLTTMYLFGALLLCLGYFMNEDWRP